MRVKLGKRVDGNYRKAIEREIKKFRGDHYLWHKHITGINLNPHQVSWMNEMDTKGDSHLLIGSRRIRKSFTVSAYFLEEAMCLPYSEVNIHSPALEQSKRNMRYMNDMVMNSEIALAYIDERLGEGIGKEHLEFLNRSIVYAKGQASSVDGLGATHQWLEEFDDMDFETFLTRIYPTGSQIKDDHHYDRHQGCLRVITGTIKGIGNIYAIEHPKSNPDGTKGLSFNVLPKYNCFTPDTVVLTDSGPKEIQDVLVDDLVITDEEIWKPVKQLHVNDYDGDLVEIKIAYNSGSPIRCTPNHKIFTERGLIRADELTVNDVVAISDQTPFIANPDECLLVNGSIAYLTGLYLANGCFDECENICIDFNKNELDLVQRARKHIAACGFNSSEYDVTTTYQIWIRNKEFARHCLAICGRYSRHKKIHPCVEHWEFEHKCQFLKGYFYGDGCEQKNSNGNDTNISSKTVNEKIAVGISRLLTQVGTRPTLNSGEVKENKIDGRTLRSTRYWRVQTERIKRIEDIGKGGGKQKKQTGKIDSIKRIKYSGKIHNLGVEGIHSYSLYTGIIVGNCWHGVEMGIIPENDILLFRALSTPHQFARTYLAMYVESSAFYPDKWVRNCADNQYLPIDVLLDPNIAYKAQGDVTIGIDCAGAGSGTDSSNWAITFTEKINNRIFWLFSQEWGANERPDKIIEEIFRLCAFFRPVSGYGDAFDTAFIYDLNKKLHEGGITRVDVRKFENKQGKNGWDEWFIKPIRFNGPTKHLMHERMQKYVYSTTYRYPALVDDDQRYTVLQKQVKQFGNIKAEKGNSGYNKYSMLTLQLGDDLIDSLIASIWAQEEIKLLVTPFGSFIPRMEFAERPGFQNLGPRFLNDKRGYNKPPDNDSLFTFLGKD